MIAMHSCHGLQPTVLAVLLFYFPTARVEWNVFVGEAYFCWLSISGSGRFYGAILSISKPFFIILFPKLHCPEIALYINVNHAYVLRVSQGTKLPLQTQCRRTTVSLHLLSTNLAGCGRRRWHSCSFLDSHAFQLRWQPINLSACNSRSKEYFRVSGISTILRLSQTQTGVRLVCFIAPSPALSLLQDPRGILLEALPLFLRKTRTFP